MPTLHVLAGPNGAGKTTFYTIATESGFINKKLPFVNVDIITKGLGGYTEENYLKASEIYRQRSGIKLFKKVYLIDNLTNTPQVQIKMVYGIIVQKRTGFAGLGKGSNQHL